jgi:lipopolysaccharide/colanic/teichoic acid biosynthesis glycosyltransferase
MQDMSNSLSNPENGRRPQNGLSRSLSRVSIPATKLPPYRVLRNPGMNNSILYPVSAYQTAYNTAFNQAWTGGGTFGVPSGTGTYRAAGKRILDIALVVLLAPLALILIGLSALFLWLEGGSPFYRQARLGKDGSTFSIVKLRTMVRDADQLLERHLAADPALRAEWNSTQKLKSDPRVTRMGALLRKTSLDELPQLWNVLMGDMSLVGPRPMLPEQLPLYGDPQHYFALRPGITGYWQVSKRNEGTFLSRVALDAEYDFNMSPIEDAKVLLRTVGAVVKRTGY